MRINDWSSDVCSSDLRLIIVRQIPPPAPAAGGPHGDRLLPAPVAVPAVDDAAELGSVRARLSSLGRRIARRDDASARQSRPPICRGGCSACPVLPGPVPRGTSRRHHPPDHPAPGPDRSRAIAGRDPRTWLNNQPPPIPP